MDFGNVDCVCFADVMKENSLISIDYYSFIISLRALPRNIIKGL